MSVVCTSLLGYFMEKIVAHVCATRLIPVNGYTLWEILHTINQSLHKYEVESSHDTIGEEDTGKSEKTLYDQYFWISSCYMNQRSKRDSPTQSSCTDYTANTCMTAREHCGNQILCLVRCYVKDVMILFGRVFSK